LPFNNIKINDGVGNAINCGIPTTQQTNHIKSEQVTNEQIKFNNVP